MFLTRVLLAILKGRPSLFENVRVCVYIYMCVCVCARKFCCVYMQMDFVNWT